MKNSSFLRPTSCSAAKKTNKGRPLEQISSAAFSRLLFLSLSPDRGSERTLTDIANEQAQESDRAMVGPPAPSSLSRSTVCPQQLSHKKKTFFIGTSPQRFVPESFMMTYLPTLFPVGYRKSGPATGLPEILWFLPDFSQPGTSVQNLDSCWSAPRNCWKDEGLSFMATASSRSLACDVAESTARELVCFGFGLDRGSVFVQNSCSVADRTTTIKIKCNIP